MNYRFKFTGALQRIDRTLQTLTENYGAKTKRRTPRCDTIHDSEAFMCILHVNVDNKLYFKWCLVSER